MNPVPPNSEGQDPDVLAATFSAELVKLEPSRRERILRAVLMAALGSIPWVGGFIAALANVKNEESQATTDYLQRQWLEEHAKKIKELAETLGEMRCIDIRESRAPEFGETSKDNSRGKILLRLIYSRCWSAT
jgi:hypothetical protein